MSTGHPPLTPADCDLTGYDWFPLQHKRLKQSEWWLTASDLARSRNVDLWAEAYEQVPAASLPNSDVVLARFAGYGRDVEAFRAVKAEIMAAWVLCSDGRFYHPVLAEVAREAWERRKESEQGKAQRKAASKVAADARWAAERAERERRQSEEKPGEVSVPDAAVMRPACEPDAGRIETAMPNRTGQDRREEDADASFVGSSDPTPRPDDVRKAFEAYNALAGRLGLPKARSLDDGRRRAIRSRLGNGGLEAWTQALAAVEASPHCRGENDRSWRADLDFICQPKSWRRLLEGAYGGKLAMRQQTAAVAPTSRFTGPPEVREDIRTCIGRGEDVVRFELDRCGWRDLPAKTIVAPNAVVADKLKNAVGWRLREMGIGIEVERQVA